MFDWLRQQLDIIRAPELDWIQVEVTTCCTSRCSYCPHKATHVGLPKKHMPLDLFLQLVPYMDHTKMIYLQGWGEPLLHPDFFQMIRLCKEKKKCVGFTTNGMLLDRKTIQLIIDSRVDILGVSLAGVTAGTHNRFREGNDFDTLIANLRLLDRMKREQNSPYPDLHLAYLMLKSNFQELETIVPLAKELGVRQIVAINLSLVLNQQFFSEAIFNNADLMEECSRALANIKQQAQQDGIVLSYSQPWLNETSLCCNENVSASCIVNVDGEVSPCVFTNPILSAPKKNQTPSLLFKNHAFPLKGISFGNIKDESLTRIWRQKEYAAFRVRFKPEAQQKSLHSVSDLPEQCQHCYKRLMISA